MVQMDGDGQHDPACIRDLLAPVLAGETDFCLGSRFLGLESYAPSLARKVGMAFFRWLVSSLIKTRITDSTSGFQAFNRRVIRYFTTEVFPCDYPDADMLITLHRAGFRIRRSRSGCMPASPGNRCMPVGSRFITCSKCCCRYWLRC